MALATVVVSPNPERLRAFAARMWPTPGAMPDLLLSPAPAPARMPATWVPWP